MRHVGIDRADPVLAPDLAEVAGRRTARIVDEDVGVWRSRKHCEAALFAGNVGRDRGHVDASLAPEVVCKSGERTFAKRVNKRASAVG